MLRGRERLISVSDRLTTGAIFLLLFLLGISVGTNDQVVGNIGTLGVQAAVLTAGGIAGSVAASCLVSPALRDLPEGPDAAEKLVVE